MGTLAKSANIKAAGTLRINHRDWQLDEFVGRLHAIADTIPADRRRLVTIRFDTEVDVLLDGEYVTKDTTAIIEYVNDHVMLDQGDAAESEPPAAMMAPIELDPVLNAEKN